MTSDRDRDQTFLLPDLGEGLTEAEIVRWLVAEGDVVVVDQPVVEVETAKSVVEVPRPYAGRVAHPARRGGRGRRRRRAADHDRRRVGRPPRCRGLPRGGAGRLGQRAHRLRHRRAPAAPGRTTPATRGLAPPAPVRGRRLRPTRPLRSISPLVRRLARDGGVDLRALTPTGAGGVDHPGRRGARRSGTRSRPRRPSPSRRRRRASRRAPYPAQRVPQGRRRRAVAQPRGDPRGDGLGRRRRDGAVGAAREQPDAPADPGPGLLAYLARFVVAGLQGSTRCSTRGSTPSGRRSSSSTPSTSASPCRASAGWSSRRCSARRPMTHRPSSTPRSATLTARAREGRATAEELAAGTFTLNNYGSFNVDGSAAIINHPQVAILGFGRIIDRPWVVDGEIVAAQDHPDVLRLRPPRLRRRHGGRLHARASPTRSRTRRRRSHCALTAQPARACLSIRGGCRRRPGARWLGAGAHADWASSKRRQRRQRVIWAASGAARN